MFRSCSTRVHVSKDHRHLYLAMELCEGGELFYQIQSAGSYDESDAALIMSQFTLEGVLLGVALPPAVETLLRKAAAHREANVGAQSRVNV